MPSTMTIAASVILLGLHAVQVQAQTSAPGVIEVLPGAGEAGITAALARIKELRRGSYRHGRIELHFARGVYRLSKPITLDGEDSASDADGVTLRGDPGVRITGTVAVKNFVASGSPQVYVAAVPEVQGLASSGFTPFGYASPPSTMPPEAFADHRRLKPSPWAEDDVATVSSAQPAGQGWTLNLKMVHLPDAKVGQDAFALVRWNGDWNYSYERVVASTSAPPSITVAEHDNRPINGETTVEVFDPSKAIKKLGEYFLDAKDGRLYIRSSSIPTQQIEVSVAEHLLTVHRGTGVEVDGIEWDGSRSDAIVIDGGTHVRLIGLQVQNDATTGILLTGTDNLIADCVIQDVGGTGINLDGGDRQTLRPGNNSVLRTTVRRFGVIMPSYRPAIVVHGVGNTIADSAFSDGPHAGVILFGNNHVIRNNFFGSLVRTTDDAGALYTGRDWTERGTVITANTFRDIHGLRNRSAAVYLDDQESGTRIADNDFINVSVGVILGGGDDNLISSNHFDDTPTCLAIDNRGMTWQKNDVLAPNSDLRRHLEAVPFNSSAYLKAYPTLANILQDNREYRNGT